MKVRPAQVDSMGAEATAQYCRELRDFFRDKCPGLVQRLDDDTLIARIAAAVERAGAQGLESDAGNIAFVGMSLAAGPAFFDDPEINRFLAMPGNDHDAKVQWLFGRVLGKLEAARLNTGDANA
jgi:hypothetical protein